MGEIQIKPFKNLMDEKDCSVGNNVCGLSHRGRVANALEHCGTSET